MDEKNFIKQLQQKEQGLTSEDIEKANQREIKKIFDIGQAEGKIIEGRGTWEEGNIKRKPNLDELDDTFND